MTFRPLSARLVVAALVVALLPAAAAARTSAPGERATTKSYIFKLSIGMPEQMWTPAQVKAKHPKTGEVMLTGPMDGGMSMSGSTRHLEVHIYSRATGKVVEGAHPTITALATTVKDGTMITISAAEMKGVASGASDLHYGDNVDLIGGHLYRVTVTLRGERAVLAARAPK